MNDFLRNLRSSRKQESSDPKRNLDGHYYPKNDRRKTTDRRSTRSNDSIDNLISGLIDMLPKLSDNSVVLSSFFEQMETKLDHLIDAKIKQHEAVSEFFVNLNGMLIAPSPSTGTPVKAKTSYASGTRYTKDEILDIMQSLRKEGSTFAQIAEHLTEKRIPTFSGKGNWHAQTIHRLCK